MNLVSNIQDTDTKLQINEELVVSFLIQHINILLLQMDRAKKHGGMSSDGPDRNVTGTEYAIMASTDVEENSGDKEGVGVDVHQALMSLL